MHSFLSFFFVVRRVVFCGVVLYNYQPRNVERMVVEMTGISVRFETGELGGKEVLILRYRLRRFVIVRFFTETYDPCTGEVCSAMDNMVGFVYRLMRFVSEHPEYSY